MNTWLRQNGNGVIISEPKKCHYISLGKNKEYDIFKLGIVSMNYSQQEMILRLAIGNKLFFDNYKKYIFRKATQNVRISRISSYLDLKQKEILFKGMIRSHFSYCPFVWMFSSRKSNNLI